MSEADSNKHTFQHKLLEKQQEAKVIRKIVLVIFAGFVILMTGLIGGGYLYIKSALQPVDEKDKNAVDVNIPIGSSVSTIASILEEKNIIKDERVFKYYIKFKNESGFQAGEYKLNPSMEIKDIVASLKSGKVITDVVFRIPVPEGIQVTEIAKGIAKNTGYTEKEILDRMNNKDFISAMQKKYPETITKDIYGQHIKYPLEGYFYPATYPFYEEKPSLDFILEEMIKKTNTAVKPYIPQLEERKMTVHQFLTMASLIEEEATQSIDRDKISSVFYNRIDEKMPLQTDPTVLYALGEHKDRVFYKDLEIDSPYNTYKVQGLPPGPIANAGNQSMKAAVEPEETDYLYFLATKKGEVIFTKTLKEHNKAKAEHISNK
ncbi:endolytic transglycosylase MltG [Bacillus sp. UMB0893]|uniref:endolytic transglycosylase MltG n=1 Tax=Bacillus sp. UMB0893 TaxID=2066053 RepID=UPI000C75B147|nr:endolytic transglycosylase MltG [Bacillus sp. UMB0893]PLR68232.1 endolytic transglycosylase MltG [Bacillus sp. UMB0893]QNG61122.1 endolytic transglycosylase MltG [Bacillus sp. PAMC26568]